MLPGLSSLAPEWMPDNIIQGAAELGVGAFAKFLGPVQARDGATTLPYEFENIRVDTVDWDPGVPTGIWRSVGNYYNGEQLGLTGSRPTSGHRDTRM
jgi:hypothetical protein